MKHSVGGWPLEFDPTEPGDVAKYEKKIFTGPAAFTVTKMTVGLTACKDCFSILCPGFMNDHHPATHEHPPVV